LLFASLLAGRDSFADDSAAIPAGAAWFCYTTTNEWNPSDRAARCVRTEAACNALRERSDESPTIAPALVSECREQKKAAVVTYFDVMQDTVQAWALPTSDECDATRKFLLKSRDFKRVSGCTLVGERVFPPGRFDAQRTARGVDWFCTNHRHTNACSRDRDVCNKASDEVQQGSTCVSQKRAVALTWDSLVANYTFGATTSMQASGIGVFRSNSDCESFRKHFGAIVRYSACTVVGAVEGQSPAASELPEGTDWSCWRPASRESTSETCFRDVADCEARVSEQVANNSTPRPKCTPKKDAWLYTTMGNYFAFDNAETCRRAAGNDEYASKCISVGAIGVAKKPEVATQSPAVESEVALPESLDRTMISAGIANVKARITACRETSSAIGKVKIKVLVRPDGAVDDVTVETTPDAQLSACVVEAIQRAHFSKTQAGGSFSYPFVF
jgi:hypothetical protein